MNPNSIDLQRVTEEAILTAKDLFSQVEAINDLARIGVPSAAVQACLMPYLQHPVPVVTASAINLFRYTGVANDAIIESVANMLTIENYRNNLSDEVINAIGWANEFIDDGEENTLTRAFEHFVEEAREHDDLELLEFCQGYDVVRDLRSKN